jgi:hypothetical protein
MLFLKYTTRLLKQQPLHLPLLPVFFILSMHLQYAGLLDTGEMAVAFLKIAAALLIGFVVFLFFYRNKEKAALLTTLAGILVLFFGNIKEAMAKIPVLDYISHYRILLPLLLLLAIIILIKTKRATRCSTVTLFLNVLFILYIAIDVWRWARLPSTKIYLSGYDEKLVAIRAKDSLPNIYYIVPDGYPSSSYLKEILGVANNQLDSILKSKGFFLADRSRSNYNNTAFSMSSALNMQYPASLHGIDRANPHHYNQAILHVKTAPVFSILARQGYSIVNLSVFDLPGQPALLKERFISATTTGMLFYHTLWSHMKWEIIPSLFPSYRDKLTGLHRKQTRKKLEKFMAYNKQVVDSLLQLSSPRKTFRRFTYAHLEMPHFPYFYDKSGHPYPDELIYSDSMITHKERFRNYVEYTNHTIAALVDTIFRRNGGRDIIVIQSDHGINDIPGSAKTDIFRNYSAVYFPDTSYQLLYREMSNVNTFRIIFNKYFGQKLPLLNDTCYYIK